MAIGRKEQPRKALDPADRNARIEIVDHFNGGLAKVRHPGHSVRIVAPTGVRDDQLHQSRMQAKGVVQIAFRQWLLSTIFPAAVRTAEWYYQRAMGTARYQIDGCQELPTLVAGHRG